MAKVKNAPSESPRRPLAGADVVCFANDWDGDPLSKKQLMRRLAKTNRVLWVSSLGNRKPRATGADVRRMTRKLGQFAVELVRGPREVEPGLFVMTPLAVPAYGSPWVRALNERLVATQVNLALRRIGMSRVVCWSFVPSSAVAVEHIGARAIVYHCVDDYSAFSDAPAADIESLERELSRKAHLVITCSEPLRRSRERWNTNTVLVRHGVDHAHFARALDPDLQVPRDLDRLARPRIGFFGLIADWVDLGVVRKLALAYPAAQIVMIGKVDTDPVEVAKLEGLANVHFLGRKPYADLPAYAKGFDVAILPFARNELTRNANPLKLREYIAAGLPVVTTDLPETRALLGTRAISLAASDQEFVDSVGVWLDSADAGPRAWRSRAVTADGWDGRLADCCRHIETVLGP